MMDSLLSPFRESDLYKLYESASEGGRFPTHSHTICISQIHEMDLTNYPSSNPH